MPSSLPVGGRSSWELRSLMDLGEGHHNRAIRRRIYGTGTGEYDDAMSTSGASDVSSEHNESPCDFHYWAPLAVT